ncbi:hypothetical protein Q5752_006647 [Cryptotrichosporon argae]
MLAQRLPRHVATHQLVHRCRPAQPPPPTFRPPVTHHVARVGAGAAATRATKYAGWAGAWWARTPRDGQEQR